MSSHADGTLACLGTGLRAVAGLCAVLSTVSRGRKWVRIAQSDLPLSQPGRVQFCLEGASIFFGTAELAMQGVGAYKGENLSPVLRDITTTVRVATAATRVTQAAAEVWVAYQADAPSRGALIDLALVMVSEGGTTANTINDLYEEFSLHCVDHAPFLMSRELRELSEQQGIRSPEVARRVRTLMRDLFCTVAASADLVEGAAELARVGSMFAKEKPPQEEGEWIVPVLDPYAEEEEEPQSVLARQCVERILVTKMLESKLTEDERGRHFICPLSGRLIGERHFYVPTLDCYLHYESILEAVPLVGPERTREISFSLNGLPVTVSLDDMEERGEAPEGYLDLIEEFTQRIEQARKVYRDRAPKGA